MTIPEPKSNGSHTQSFPPRRGQIMRNIFNAMALMIGLWPGDSDKSSPRLEPFSAQIPQPQHQLQAETTAG
ncbi:hypothetical protein CJ030_MR1G007759 [Morella rubra]|uniref:Uncharacterized protein n=1 Tax=Morella rubra TaxID=262757 RepID=A0A6A1WLL3_9ROSI|nr:hypothetical protein CJ030_MR1G007759 [Morella rubra]